MPCTVTREEEEYYAARAREQDEANGRWDKLASREQLAGWLCDAMSGRNPTDGCKRWWTAHKKHNDTRKKK